MRIGALLPVAYWTLTAAILLWDIQLAGRIAQNRRAPRPLALLSAVAGLLVAPAALAAAAAPSLLSGRAVQSVTWLWPVVAVLFVLQAAYAVLRRYVTPTVGIPFLLYNLVLAAVAVARHRLTAGDDPAAWLVGFSAAHVGALGSLLGDAALWSPLSLQVPLLAPITPARWRLSATLRAGLAVYAAAWGTLVLLVEYPHAVREVRTFAELGERRLQERPAGDFRIGVHVFPTIGDRPPTPLVVRNDLALVDSLDGDALSLTLSSEATAPAVLDSLSRLFEPVRRDTTVLVVRLAHPRDAAAAYARDPQGYTRARTAELRRVLRGLRPDIVVPLAGPDPATRPLPLEAAREYLTAAASVVAEVRPRTQVAALLTRFDTPDSRLSAWAAARGSPVEVIGFALAPSFDGGLSLQARMAAAERWMAAAEDPRRAAKPHWVLNAQAYPLAHGERSQLAALWGTIAWATTHPELRGVVVSDAADYQRIAGLRVTGGRLRPATGAVAAAVRLLRETAVQ